MKPIPRPIVILIVGLSMVALLLKGFANYLEQSYSSSYTSDSIQVSKDDGKFIKQLNARPAAIQIEGKSVQFKEIWLEHRTQHVYILFLFKTVKKLGNYHLCFRLDQPIPSSYEFKGVGNEYQFAGPAPGVYWYPVEPPIAAYQIDLYKTANEMPNTKVGEVQFS